MPTIHDVARAAGVGIGTVSRVLNRSSLVSAATRQRVLAAIEQLGYQPSPIARAFGRRRTEQLEVVVPRFAQAFLVDILSGISDGLADTDFTVLLRTVETEHDRDRVFEECCVRGRSDGVLLVWLPPTEALVQRLLDVGLPLVLVNAEHPRCASVGVDHAASAASAVEYCLRLGHRRIGLIDRRTDVFDGSSPGICRAGYIASLHAAGIEAPDALQQVAELSPDAGGNALQVLLAMADAPTAVLVGSDAQAIGAISAARAAGRRVPEDLSLVGYNDNDVTRYLGLTTVTLPLRELGRLAVERLVALVSEPEEAPSAAHLPTHLTVRRTCGPPAA